MKVSGQFNNIKSAKYFARIKSYIETALKGRAYTIEEMKKHNEFD